MLDMLHTRNLESGHTASGLNEYDLREPAGDFRTVEEIEEATKIGDKLAEDEHERAYWALVDKDNAERIYAEADAEDHAEMLERLGLTQEEWDHQIAMMEDEPLD
jgi:hypothetical protein